MNERIKELWDKAKVNLDEDFSSGRKSIRTSIAKSYDEMVQEKFAELIVKECVGVCEEYHGTAGDQAAQYIGQGIKEHFGVEE